ncbi:globin [Cytobacillus sp. S13-E01]|uniref:globin domain-containing protein n=1 Tax=Cytobacillus sp. S13-E01 TaxID=3031326 RepID=UPI0023D84494|nr:globin [Cytobacillus sp. S13-E01]MDF0726871.1 globin [Cytobacillus sp. S13-E01]
MTNFTMESLYKRIGGAETLERLVNAFYPKVYADSVLSPLFEGNIEDIKRKQTLFLTQFLGGPALYSNEFGPPAMRERHLPFEITPTRASAWLHCMKEAFEEIGLKDTAAAIQFYDRLKQVATIMINAED